MRHVIPLLLVLSLAACAKGPFSVKPKPVGAGGEATAQSVRPQSRPDGFADAAALRKPPSSARTVEQFDTTTAQERKAAAAAPPQASAETALGSTVASLGDPTKPGFWLETPLVSKPSAGRVLFPGSGKSAQVDLIPIEGPNTAGSRISLAAMRLIEAPLTDLPTIEVFAGAAQVE